MVVGLLQGLESLSLRCNVGDIEETREIDQQIFRPLPVLLGHRCVVLGQEYLLQLPAQVFEHRISRAQACQHHEVVLHTPKIRQRIQSVALALDARTQLDGEIVLTLVLEPRREVLAQLRDCRIVGYELDGEFDDDLGSGQIAGRDGGADLDDECLREAQIVERGISRVELTNGPEHVADAFPIGLDRQAKIGEQIVVRLGKAAQLCLTQLGHELALGLHACGIGIKRAQGFE